MRRIVLLGLLSLFASTIIGVPVRCDEDQRSMSNRMQLYFKWLGGTATQEEREAAAQTIIQDASIGIVLTTIIAGGASCGIRWCIAHYKQNGAVRDFVSQLIDLNNTATKQKEIPSFDIPDATVTMRICTYDGSAKKNVTFLISDTNATWQTIPVLKKSIGLLCKQGLFDKIQVHKAYRSNQDLVLYGIEKKDGRWQEIAY